MEMHELLKQDTKKLQEMLAQHQEELRQARFEAANLQLKNVRTIRSTRRQIARIKTALATLSKQDTN